VTDHRTTLAAYRAVEQTLATHRIEGWQPAPAEVADLHALAAGTLGFGDCLANWRAQYPPTPVRRRLLRRSVPYLISGTTVLRNNFGVSDAAALAALEYLVTAGRTVLWHRTVPAELDPRAIHRELFSDAYDWAGEYRTVDLRRGGSAFLWQSDVAAAMTELRAAIDGLVAIGADYDNPRLAWELSRIYVRYNQIHPFREGNGRTGMLLLHALAGSCGRGLDLSPITREDWYHAARDSMPLRRDGVPSHRPFLPLLNRAVKTRLTDRADAD
jgi:cell filamentation protein